MTEEQKYRRKKNFLVLTLMFLLLVFVALMCFIFIYVKMHPKKEFTDPNTIEIKTMLTTDYQSITEMPTYNEVVESTRFVIREEDRIISLTVNENNEVISSETNEKIEIMLDGTDINNNISLVYQSDYDNLIFTMDGKLYRLEDKKFVDGRKLNVKQIVPEMRIKNIAKLNIQGESTFTYVLTADNKLINLENGEEYNRIIKELPVENGTIYVYDDFSFGFEKGKIITDTEGNIIKFNLLFKDKLVDERAVIYDLDFINKTVTTSKLGTMVQVGYGKIEGGDYNITMEANTGYYEFTSSYYYSR